MSYENPWIFNGEIFESDHIEDILDLYIIFTLRSPVEVT